jgi:hypothetical protein
MNPSPKPSTNDNRWNLMNLFGRKGFMGITKTNKKKESKSYSIMKMKQITKRRARNKLARKCRRINRLRAS